ncbi:MAG: ABC transporter ATP-binding protein [Victivallales bacterium]|nr:ABC transporter ATP-binding protein [Victivallales bacterium]
MALLTCHNLTLGYENQPLVRNLNFTVEAGDYLCILGNNGAGKSTLMRTLLGLQAPIAGTIEKGDGLASNEIGYLPQQTLVQRDFPATVWEVALSGCQGRCGLFPFYRKTDKAIALRNIERMGLIDFIHHSYRELSGGQQQRVLLARALCATQKLLLLDEPVAGLDPHMTLEMYRLIQELNRDEHITIVMVSHDIQGAIQYATHILHLGHEVFYGTRADYEASPMGRYFLAWEGEQK